MSNFVFQKIKGHKNIQKIHETIKNFYALMSKKV